MILKKGSVTGKIMGTNLNVLVRGLLAVGLDQVLITHLEQVT